MSDYSQPFAPAFTTEARVAELRRAAPQGGLSALVVGGGKSGMAALELLRAHGHEVRLADDRAAELAAEPRLAGVPVAPLTAEVVAQAELVVLSPGVPRRREELAGAVRRGVLVGEIELASWFLHVPLLGITGTNGKSTTTALAAHVLESAGLKVFAGGNLGRPLADLALSRETVDVAVVELSSYQLESIVDATFEVACWLNLTPDHADRYPTMETYALAKRRILERRTVHGVGVLNAKDPACAQAGIRLGGPLRWFAADAHSDLAGPAGTLLVRAGEEGRPPLAVRTEAGHREEYPLENPFLVGRHNLANMCAAIECTRHFGLSPGQIIAGLASFRGLPHRLELVGEVGGVRYYNDSKATNVDSAVIALEALPGRKILIAGGKDKGAPWTPLVERARDGVQAVLAIGAATPIVLAAFRGQVPLVEDAGTLEHALARARELARPGDVVLLAPACASFDQFRNYEHRGDTFRALVRALGEGKGQR